jgi:hypothetical protein
MADVILLELSSKIEVEVVVTTVDIGFDDDNN